MPLAPSADRRPVLEQEEEAQAVSARKKTSEESLLIPVRTPSSSAGTIELTRVARVVLRPLGRARVDAEVLEPARDRVGGALKVRLERLELAGDAEEDDQEGGRPDGDDAEHHQGRAEPARDPVAVERPTTGEPTAATIDAVRTGSTIVLVSAISQTAPETKSVIPTSSQAENPMSRSQPGAAKIPLSSAGSISM